VRVILGGIAISVTLALAAGAAFYAVQTPVYESQPLPSVRVGDPGDNLVGPDWSGNPGNRADQARSNN
jgi:hypothetical protein